jgi:hypothetical protein
VSFGNRKACCSGVSGGTMCKLRIINITTHWTLIVAPQE